MKRFLFLMAPVGGRRICGGDEMVCRVRRAAVRVWTRRAHVCGAGALACEELLTMRLVYLPCRVVNFVTEGLVWGSGHLHSANHSRDYNNGVCKNC